MLHKSREHWGEIFSCIPYREPNILFYLTHFQASSYLRSSVIVKWRLFFLQFSWLRGNGVESLPAISLRTHSMFAVLLLIGRNCSITNLIPLSEIANKSIAFSIISQKEIYSLLLAKLAFYQFPEHTIDLRFKTLKIYDWCR